MVVVVVVVVVVAPGILLSALGLGVVSILDSLFYSQVPGPRSQVPGPKSQVPSPSPSPSPSRLTIMFIDYSKEVEMCLFKELYCICTFIFLMMIKANLIFYLAETKKYVG